jgi:hypothetical protein
MPVAPLTTGAGAREATVQGWGQVLTDHFGPAVGNSFIEFADTHTNLSARTALQQWSNAQAANLGPQLGQVTKQLLQAAGTLPAAGVKALPALDVFKGLNLGTWVMRIGEILIGLVLIGVGLAKITNAVPIATKIASVVK